MEHEAHLIQTAVNKLDDAFLLFSCLNPADYFRVTGCSAEFAKLQLRKDLSLEYFIALFNESRYEIVFRPDELAKFGLTLADFPSYIQETVSEQSTPSTHEQ